MLQLLSKKIYEACKPLTQVFEHLEKQNMPGKDEIKKDIKPPQSGILLTMQVNSIYFALIRE